MNDWIDLGAQAIAGSADDAIAALVDISSPSGDASAAEAVVEAVIAMLPPEVSIERVPCSSPDHADDLVVRLYGSGSGRMLLVGHVDTVVAHDAHEPLRVDDDKLVGSGSVDMKAGDVVAVGVLRALASRREDFAQVALLMVCDEEWRLGEFTHVERFAGFDACLCFEAGQMDEDGRDAVVLRRKAAGALRITATGRSAHSGVAPERGINALLALAAVAEATAACNDPAGPDRLTVVPTVLHAGDALNVVPAFGELICDVRADRVEAFDRVLAAVPAEVGGAVLNAENLRRWPGMDHRESMAPVLEEASDVLGREIVGTQRGGASDASHFAATVPLCVDGLGPIGGLAHAPGEFVLRDSVLGRSEVALAIADALLARFRGDVLYTAAQPKT